MMNMSKKRSLRTSSGRWMIQHSFSSRCSISSRSHSKPERNRVLTTHLTTNGTMIEAKNASTAVTCCVCMRTIVFMTEDDYTTLNEARDNNAIRTVYRTTTCARCVDKITSVAIGRVADGVEIGYPLVYSYSGFKRVSQCFGIEPLLVGRVGHIIEDIDAVRLLFGFDYVVRSLGQSLTLDGYEEGSFF
jgi:hypothetical protein